MVVHFGGVAFDHECFETMRVKFEDTKHGIVFTIAITLCTEHGEEVITVRTGSLDEALDLYIDIISQLSHAGGRPAGSGILEKRRQEVHNAFRDMIANIKEARHRVKLGNEGQDVPSQSASDPSNIPGSEAAGPSLSQINEFLQRKAADAMAKEKEINSELKARKAAQEEGEGVRKED